jgi:hypothetical protein
MMSNKGKRKADEPGQGPPSKRSSARRPKSKTSAISNMRHNANSDTQLEIRLTRRTLLSCGLNDPIVLIVPSSDFLTSMIPDAKCNLLYDIMRRLFECEREDIDLYRQADGKFKPEDDGGWEYVIAEDEIMGGIYTCNVDLQGF